MPTKKVKTSSPEAETVKSAVVSEKAKESVKPVEKAEKPAENTTKKVVKTAAKKPAAEKPAVVKAEKAVQAAEEKKTEAAEQKPAAPTAEIEAKPAEKKTAAKPRAASRKKAEKAEEKAITEPEQEAPAKKGILFVASEAFPYAGTGGLGEVIGSLPKNLNKLGKYDARVIVPLYESVNAETRSKMQYIGNIYVPLAWRMQYCGLFRLEENGVVYYFVDNEYYFKRNSLYGYGDDGERFAFFSRAVLELLPMLDFTVDVLHCHDWHTALVPIYYKLYYMYRVGYNNIRTVFTIHNIEYQGQFAPEIIEDLFGISKNEYMSLDWHGCINLMKGAIDYSDFVSTVSPTYAQEIRSPQYAHGLQDILNKNAHKLRGILNGIDYDVYNPATNKSLFVNYSSDSLDKKNANKTELQKMLGLNVDERAPLIAMVSRLVNHKGIGLVRSVFHDIMNGGAQLVVLGTGDADHENFFRHMQNLYGRRVHAAITFNKDLAQKIYAGADIFLMPSLSEPCGLSQMIALRYGTVPIVRSTGGLKDSIADCGDGHTGNGFVFGGANAGELLYAVKRAVGLYYDYGDIWNELRERASKCDFSWNNSAKAYQAFYDEMF